MIKEEYKFKSHDNLTDIRYVMYKPKGKIKAILQIAHGMVEFIDRYDGFANYLTDNGYLVVGNDHLGHGESVISKDRWGYFAEHDGYKVVLEDMHELTQITKKQYPGIPYILLGHSMGSFFTRYYLQEYPNELDACIIMGTGQQSASAIAAAKVLTRMTRIRHDSFYRSKTLSALALGSYNKKWEPSKTHCDWLSKDEEVVSKYHKEPKNHFLFTVNGYYNLFSVIGEVINESKYKVIPKDLPILIVSGSDDPVGNFGKDPTDLYNKYKNVGLNKVELKLFENDRHEILNELDKDSVYEYLLNWLNKSI